MMVSSPARSRLQAAVLFAIVSGCTAVPQGSGPPPDDDGGPDSDTDTDTDADGDTDADTDQLPGWSLFCSRHFGNWGQNLPQEMARSGPETFVTTGWLQGLVSFDGYDIETIGLGRMFLLKMNLGCKVEWATWGGDEAYTDGLGVDATEDGRSAVTGKFTGAAAVFGSGEPNETWLYKESNSAASYQAVYDFDGTLAWARGFCPTITATGLGIALVEDGSVFGTGRFVGQAVLGEGSPAETFLESQGESFNSFLVHYDSNGELVWARSDGGPAVTKGFSLAALPDGSCLLLGVFHGEAVFGRGEDNETTLVPLEENSVFLARFDTLGKLEWVVDLEVNGKIRGQTSTGQLELLENGDVAVTAHFLEGSMPAGNGDDVSPVEVEDEGLFLARYTVDGARIWTRVVPVGGPYSHLFDIAELGDGTLVGAGHFADQAVFAIGEPGETHLHGPPLENGFLAAWSGDGEFLWALLQGSEASDRLRGVAAFSDPDDGHDIIVTAGHFKWIAEYGTGGGDEVTYESEGNEDISILRFDREAP
jgi:hypothetical protein